MIALITFTETLMLLVGLLVIAFVVNTLFHITQRDMPVQSKFWWILAVLLLSPVGIVIYYLIGAKQPRIQT